MTMGAGTFAYGAAAGAMAAISLLFFSIAVHRQKAMRRDLGFAVFALLLALAAMVTLWLQRSVSVDEYTDRLKVFGLAGLVVLVGLVGLVHTWSSAFGRVVLVTFLGATVIIAVLQLTLPEGLLASDITALREVQLLGETFVVHGASTSPWRPLLDLYLLFTATLVAISLWRGIRRPPRRDAVVLAVGIGAISLAGLYDSLVDEGVVSTPYLAPFGAVFIVAVGAWHLSTSMVRTERRLADQSNHLEATIIDRTAALVDANLELEVQLARQRASAQQLAALAEQFEAVNSLVLQSDGDGLERNLGGVLANLGDLLDAESVTLRPSRETSPDAIGAEIGWHRTGDQSEHGLSATAAIREPLVIGPRSLGELEVVPARELGASDRRYIELTSDHLAGFLDRLGLSTRIAATAVDAERHRIARDLHDSVTQKLYSVSFLAEAVPQQLRTDSERAAATVGRIRQLLLSSLAELRTLLFELRPEALHAAPLPTLVSQLANMFGTGPAPTIETQLEPVGPLPTDVKVGMYRIVQEALSNAIRHSKAAVVSVELRERAGTVELIVRDRGVGFRPETTALGDGLRNLRERAAALGARLDVDSAPGVGTAVIVQYPDNSTDSTTSLVDGRASGGPR